MAKGAARPKTAVVDAPAVYHGRGRWEGVRDWIIRLARSFGYAFAGVGQLMRRQRNARIHLFLSALAAGAAWVGGFSRVEWLALVLTIALVLGMEAVNTAIEAVVDLASPEFHPLAKQAKDVAAGGVLLAAIGAVIIALLLFGERLLRLLLWLAG